MILVAGVLLTGCGGGRKQTKVNVPPPPPIAQPEPDRVPAPPVTQPETKEPAEDRDLISLPPDVKPIYTEIGIASWYGAPYHDRRGSKLTLGAWLHFDAELTLGARLHGAQQPHKAIT